jgi:hypothetical protein
MKVRTGAKISDRVDFMIYNGYVLEVHYPKEIREELDKYYNKIKRIEELDADYLFKNVFLKKIKIPITITKNAALANQMEMETRAMFEEGKR